MTPDLRRLFAAPELLVVDLLDAALDTLRRALLVEHPPLATRPPHFAESRVSRRARHVLLAVRHLRRSLDAYRRAVDDVLDDHDEDLPF